MPAVPVVAIPCRQLTDDAVGILRNYVEAMTTVGAAVVLIPMQDVAFALASLASVDGILFAGGEDLGLPDSSNSVAPERDRLERALARAALAADMPILGICRGMQLLNDTLGGSTAPIEAVAKGRPLSHQVDWRGGEVFCHAVTLGADSLLAEICGRHRVMVNGTHTQCLGELAPGLRPTAHSDDGIVEAIERSVAPLQLGVQWHPEVLVKHADPLACGIFARFVESCLSYRMTRGTDVEAS